MRQDRFSASEGPDSHLPNIVLIQLREHVHDGVFLGDERNAEMLTNPKTLEK